MPRDLLAMEEEIPYEEDALEEMEEPEGVADDVGLNETFMGRMRNEVFPGQLDVEQAMGDPSFAPDPDPNPAALGGGSLGLGGLDIGGGNLDAPPSAGMPEDLSPSLPQDTQGQDSYKNLLYQKMKKRRDRSDRFQQLAFEANRKMFERY